MLGGRSKVGLPGFDPIVKSATVTSATGDIGAGFAKAGDEVRKDKASAAQVVIRVIGDPLL
jgi:hypothetical protein